MLGGRLQLRAAVLAATALAGAVLVGCGGRSSLRLGGSTQGDAGPGGAGGAAGSGGGGAAPAPCVLLPAGDPIELLAFAEGDVGTVDLAVVAPGAPGSEARVVHQAVSEDANFWHPELRFVDYAIGGAWPLGVATGHAPTLVGVDAHAGGRTVPAPGTPGSVGLLWYHGDLASPSVTPGVKFRSFDTASWSGGAEHFVDEAGEVVYALAPGASVGPSDEGYVGDGYVALWRGWVTDDAVTTRLAILGSDGALALAPLPVTPLSGYPGRSADAVWTGSRYVVAVSHDAASCLPGPPGSAPPCEPDAVQTYELVPPGAVEATLEPRAVLPLASPGEAPFRPRLARHGDGVVVAWSEGAADGAGPRTVRAAHLDAMGALVGEPTVLGTGVELLAPVAIGASELGFVVAWVERGAPDVPPETPGFGRLVVRHLAADGIPDPEPVALAVTEPAGLLAITAIAWPRAALVSWSGARVLATASPHVSYLARLDCATPLP